ncbi:MAG: ABC transporter ATP-binding protein [Chloroflexota bacterium]|nr:ABC transporter ATP-binding protein [Chloroflexota bacterium]
MTTGIQTHAQGHLHHVQPPRILFEDVGKDFRTRGSGSYTAVDNVSFEIPSGSFTAIVGPSGCGKSTLLRILAGLDTPSRGEVLVEGERVRGLRPDRTGYLFQQDALLPWKTVYDNVALGLRLRGQSRSEVRETIEEWLRKVNLLDFRDRYPAQLSGGMRKRVAIAQTLATDPPLLLMDEPFTALDVQTRHLMEMDLLELSGEGARTVVLVTHDLDEAAALADRVVVLSSGPRSSVKAVVPVEIPRPRDLLAIRSNPRYGDVTRFLWNQLYEEVRRSYGR